MQGISGNFPLLIFFTLLSLEAKPQVRCGAERTEMYESQILNKNVAVVANAASLSDSGNTVDFLIHRGIKVTRVFCPEHGFRSFAEAGVRVDNSIDTITGLPVISLYGKKKKPDTDDLKDVDVVVFDLQDVGVRCYTYLSTLSLIMEACSKEGITLIVFDRPNPNGFYIDGPVMDSSQYSFVGMHPVPLVYGMTIGEYAKMINGEGWLRGSSPCDLEVIPLGRYTHSTRYNLPASPSPNLTTMNAVYLYPSLVLFEGTIISVGRGTKYPFQVFGHPSLRECTFYFIPAAGGASAKPLYNGQVCCGIDLRDYFESNAGQAGQLNLNWLITTWRNLGTQPHFFNDLFDHLAGTPDLRRQIIQGMPEDAIRQSWKDKLEEFKKIRRKYLLYPE